MPRDKLFGAYRFQMEVEAKKAGGFTEISGLSMETEVQTLWEGGLNDRPHKLPVKTSYTDLVLKRGLYAKELYDWYIGVVQGRFKRKNLTINLLDDDGNIVMEWDIAGAYPVSWDGPSLSADSSAIASETVKITHEGIQLKRLSSGTPKGRGRRSQQRNRRRR